ncbi:MAG: autotransporter outer membrane beta-barrel domain-containing protein, partial [Burkholderiales bacterium]
TVNVSTGAAFATENTISTGRLVIESGARLRVGASGHGLTVTDASADAMLNAGTLAVAEGVTANVTGNYEQSGTLRVGASSSASHGRLSVTGNANLTSTARFDVDVNTSQTLAAGDTLSGVLSATGALTNAAPAGNVSDNSALFDFRSATNGNQIDLEVLAAGADSPSQPGGAPVTDSTSPGEGIVPATVRAGLVNGVPAAQVLDGYIRGGRTGTDWDAVVTALGQLPDDASVAQAVGQAMPSMHGNASRALLAHASSTGAALVEQLAWSGLGSGDAAPGTGLWVKPMSTWVEQDRYRQISGYRVRSQGLVGGYQTSFGPGSTIGFGLAYLDGRVEGRDFATGQRSDLESVQLLGYGSYDLSGWRLQWQADATRSSVKSLRWLGFIGRSAQASYRGNTWHIGLNIGRPMDMSGTTVTPSVGLDWRRTRSGAYTETGAGALNLRVAAQTAEELIVKLGVQARHPLGRQTHLLAMAAVGYDLASGRDTTTAQFTGGGAVFSTQGLARRRAVAELGLGVTHRASDSMELSVRYDLMVREGLTDQGASLRLDWRF